MYMSKVICWNLHCHAQKYGEGGWEGFQGVLQQLLDTHGFQAALHCSTDTLVDAGKFVGIFWPRAERYDDLN